MLIDNDTRRLFRLAWPIGMEHLLNMTLLWVDAIIINHKLGTEAFAAVQISSQIFNFIMLVLMVVAAGASIVISHQVGAAEHEGAGETATQSIGMGFLISIGLGALIYSAAPVLLQLLGAVGGAHAQGIVFMRTLSLFMPAMAMIAILGAVLRATGDTRGPMMVTLVVNVLNAGLNYLLVWQMEMGVRGSAVGTSIARLCGVGLMFFMLFRRSVIPVRLRRALAFRAATIWRVGRMGLPGALEWFSYQGSQLVLSAIVGTLGTAVIAARGLTVQMEGFTYVPAIALGTAASITVGQLMGAKRRDDAVATGRRALTFGAIGMGSLGVLLFLFARPIVGVYTNDPDVVAVAVITMRIGAAYKVGQCLNIVGGAIFRGAGNPQWPTAITAAGTWLITVPLAYLAVRSGYGLPGVYAAMFLDETLRGVVNTWYFTTPRWRFRKV